MARFGKPEELVSAAVFWLVPGPARSSPALIFASTVDFSLRRFELIAERQKANALSWPHGGTPSSTRDSGNGRRLQNLHDAVETARFRHHEFLGDVFGLGHEYGRAHIPQLEIV